MKFCNGSELPVQMMGKRSMVVASRAAEALMTAVPRTAVI